MTNTPAIAMPAVAQAAQEAAAATKLTSDLLSQFLSAQEEMSAHAKRNHTVTLGGIIVTALLSFASVCATVYQFESTPKQNPESAQYQREMREMTQDQLAATQTQTRALQELSRALLNPQSLQDAQPHETIERFALDRKP